ncbi:MAG: hypothetical protein Metus_0233 [Candidatus Methanosuratincola subterraneus]|uniref:Uncharacterized protein n=1 Tax=Methanosuratincola subterraneus TaxID=2593994 RepID=A0A3S3S8W3_METS7|nr:MAG: hypothetical protein Metus_0233 [Candidatus Methanosuratincola subterraneus]
MLAPKPGAEIRLLYDNFRYTVKIDRARKRAVLVESFMGQDNAIGRVGGWRAMALAELDRHFSGRDNRERGYRLFLAAKLLPEVGASRACKALSVLKRLTLEETIFWVWQYHSYGARAIGALKHIHMR